MASGGDARRRSNETPRRSAGRPPRRPLRPRRRAAHSPRRRRGTPAHQADKAAARSPRRRAIPQSKDRRVAPRGTPRCNAAPPSSCARSSPMHASLCRTPQRSNGKPRAGVGLAPCEITPAACAPARAAPAGASRSTMPTVSVHRQPAWCARPGPHVQCVPPTGRVARARRSGRPRARGRQSGRSNIRACHHVNAVRQFRTSATIRHQGPEFPRATKPQFRA